MFVVIDGGGGPTLAGVQDRSVPWSDLTQPTRLRLPRGVSMQYAAASSAAVVLVLYGLQYYALESFYGRFGITPEQLGIGKTELLTRLAVRLGFLGFLVVLVLPVMLAVGTGRPRGVSEFLRHRSAARAWFRRGLLVLGTAAWLALTTEEIAEGHVFGPPTAFEFVIALIYAAAVVAAARPGPPRRRKALELGITLAVCVLAFKYWLGNAMEERADHVRASGHAGLLEQLVQHALGGVIRATRDR
ncbi:hypothetical protein [Streptomyces sp. NPDC048462]|uniref:hypothetical protein n=1 Tax=Streptomyces sp. NPDC048462 TaxID=3365555 RepID=UPI00371E5B2E